MTAKDFRNLRLKENKTDVEHFILVYRDALITISEVLIENNKCHITDRYTVKKIKYEVNSILNKL